MNRIKQRMSKTAAYSTEQELKAICVKKILEDNGVTLAEMSEYDIVDYLQLNDTITFENIEDLVEEWIDDTRENYPEQIL